MVRVAVSKIMDLRQKGGCPSCIQKKPAHLPSITRHDINNQMTVLQGYLTILNKEAARSVTQ